MASRYRFTSEPADALKCLICLDVAEDPWHHVKCRKLFCKKCLEAYGKSNPCPNCRAKKPKYLEDIKSQRDIRSLPVRCTYAEMDCEWEGTVATLEEHLTSCEYACKLTPCPNKCRDGDGETSLILKTELEKHLEEDCPNREHKCEHCGEMGTHMSIMGPHDRTCPKKPLPCLNSDCTEKIPRQDLANHLKNQCQHTIVPCKYRSIGCTVALKRQDMVAHEESEDKIHLRVALDALSESRMTMMNGKPMTFKLTGYQSKTDSNTSYLFPAFYTHPHGYRMAIQVYTNGLGESAGLYSSVFVPILAGKYDAELNWPFVGRITISLLNQLEDNNHFEKALDITLEDNARVDDDWGYRTFISHLELDYDPVKNTQYLKDDVLYFRVEVEVNDHKPWLDYTQQSS